MSPNEDETAVHVCHCLGDMVVRMRKVLGPYRRVDTCATGLLKTCSVLCCRWYGSTYAWCPFGQDVRVTHGGLTSLNLRVHSIITWDWVWSEDLSSSKGPVIRRPRRITPCYRFTIIHTLETNLYSYLERCKVASSLARSLANYGFKGIGYSSRCCSKINCIRWVISLLFFAMFLGISSAIFFAKCVKFAAIFSRTTYTKTAELAQLRHRASRLLCLFLKLPCSTDVILSDIANVFKN